MSKLNNFGLLIKLLSGIILGIILGSISSSISNDIIVRILLTFNALFGQFLQFVIPLLVLAFVTAGIAELGKNAGRLLVITVLLAFCSTILVGLVTFLISSNILPFIVVKGALSAVENPDGVTTPFINPNFKPVMDVISALLIAFILGAGIALTEAKNLLSNFKEFQVIIQKIISGIIIPLLPLYIAGVFADITFAGKVAHIMKTFAGVFALVITFHICILITEFIIAGIVAKKNPFTLIKNMLPAYFTALGTQSSAATIPVTIEAMQANGVKAKIADFVAPLCANIHMGGSMTTITICSTAVMLLSGIEPSFALSAQFIFSLAFAMVASPGVPGGSIMTALPFLMSILGFSQDLTVLMMALYLTQDSFGTACNVTGDGAIGVIVDSIDNRQTA
ncbi:MAG: dicarboxylate/amino acid:cation symporter [Desulfovibrionaceae bacterium]|nr:dicarboxylate/amino acid:cation symporter [Desulfovibrionaceae bacterium]